MNEPASSPAPQGKGSSCSMSVGRWERIIKTKEMVRAGANTAYLALVFGISRRMVQKDLAAARSLNRDLIDKADHSELLGEEVDAWREIIGRAMERFWLATHDNARLGFLRAIIDTLARVGEINRLT